MDISQIWLNGLTYNSENVRQKLLAKMPDWERDIFTFLAEWWNDSETITVHTSGSTGSPKEMTLPKSAFKNSAVMTGTFFKFQEGHSALSCLPAKFIAGKMMLVRATEWGLHLDYIAPKIELDIPVRGYYFSAMTPQQLESNLDKVSLIENLIIGGAPIHSALEKKIELLPANYFATYGMTETLSHIALRAINNNNKCYQVLPGISISKDERGCLIIHAPGLTSTPLVTNDLVSIIKEGQFIWEGRFDNVINSGGLKTSPETIEKKISSLIKQPFFIAGVPDPQWGETTALILEGDSINTSDLKACLSIKLDSKEMPKAIYFVPKFVYTENGKLKRKETLIKLSLQ